LCSGKGENKNVQQSDWCPIRYDRTLINYTGGLHVSVICSIVYG